VPHWVRGAETAELVEYPGQAPGTTQKIVLTALGQSPATPPEGITAPVVVVASFDELRALGREKVAGKIVLFNVPFDEQMAAAGYGFDAYGEDFPYRMFCARAAAPLGAVAALVRSIGSGDYRLPHTGIHQLAGIPAAAVTAEDAQLIADLAREGTVRMRLVLTPRTLPPAQGYNVIADLKGSEQPEQIVLVSGHLDSWDLGTGAIDDGAGVVVAMETVELLHRLGLRPRRTIRVIAWMDEEQDGSGHRAYAKDYLAEFPNHVGAIEADSGAGQPLGFRASASEPALALLQPMMQVLQSIGAGILRPSGPEGTGVDIEPLARAGVPSFGMLQDGRTYFFYHHSAADTLDKVDPKLLERNAAAMAVLAFTLADLPEPLPR
jgi:carboxypeptidase Q